MAVTTGTATDYRDFLTKLRDYLVANGWVQMGGKASGAIVSDSEFVSLRGPGLTGDDQIMLTLKPFSVPTNNAYAIGIRGHTAYVDPGIDQPGSDSRWVYMLTINAPLTYWVIANGRRFVVIVKTGSRYDAMYGGFILPDHLPSDWSYPLFIGASSHTFALSQANDEPDHSNFWNPVSSGQSGGDNLDPTSAYLFSPIQAWVPIRNGWEVGDSTQWQGAGRMTLPWCRLYDHNVRRLLDGSPYLRRGQIAGFARNVGTSYPQLPEGGTLYGSFDGVFYTPAFGATAEQETEVNGVTYKMFPNIGRTSDGHFAALAME